MNAPFGIINQNVPSKHISMMSSASTDDCKNDPLQWWDFPAEVMQKLKHMAYEALLVLRRVVLRLLASLTMSKQHKLLRRVFQFLLVREP